MNPSPRKRLLRRISIGVLILLFVWWITLRRVYFEEGMRVSLKSKGEEGAVTFVVERPDGRPAPGLDVIVETTSGLSGHGITDEQGVAVIPEYETEIVAVYIDGTSCEFMKVPLIDHVFRPDCSSGLTVSVRLDSAD
jgi:hypothetical protein